MNMECHMRNGLADRELSRFLALAAGSQDYTRFKMPACDVDKRWHERLENSREYEAFCREVAGVSIGHEPGGGYCRLDWVDDYHERFGSLPRIWFDSDIAFNAYQRTGEVIASWDCSPVQPDSMDNKDQEKKKRTKALN